MSVYSVSVYPGSVTIRKGEWYYGAYATVRASSNCCTDVTWYSDKTAVATVNAATGYIYGRSAGTARIYAQSKVDSSKWDYITVNVTNGNICVDSVCLNYGYLSLEKGDRRDLSATVCPANATNKSISWSSSNPSVATVSGGTVRAVEVGSATITARAQDGSGEYDTCYVSVTGDILVSSITLNHSSYTLNPNGAVLLRESICPTNATNKCVRWSSSNNGVARVNPDSGYVTAQGVGTAIIRATAQDGSGKYAECRVTVNPPVAVMDIEVCPTSLTMNVGDVEYLCATIIPYNATNQSVTWCSSNENVATVGIHSGRITAKRAGTATITATTADGGYQACCAVTVNQVLTGSDLLITDQNIIDTIINAKNLSDVAYDMYISGKISICQMQEIQDSAQYAADLARADFIVVNDQSDFAYQYFKGRNRKNGDISPFNREITYNSSNPITGVDVMVIQRGMQAIGFFEPKETYKFGTYDLETFNAASNNNVLLGEKFDEGAYHIVFNSTNSSQRTPQWLLDLQEYSRQHQKTQMALASRANADTEVTINAGGPSGKYAGRADVLKNQSPYSIIWEIKHNNSNNLQRGNAQLNRYIIASETNDQNFTLPLRRGYDFTTFYVRYSATTCLEVSSTSVAGLVFYKEIDIPNPAPSFVPVSLPETKKRYEYRLNPIPVKVSDVVGTVVTAGLSIICIAGGLYLLLNTGDYVPLQEGLRNFGKALGVA